MAYLKPPALTRRLFNPLAMRFGIGGAETLSVAGRRTGEQHAVPVIPVDHDGARYLVSARGETEWVRNLRAAGMGEMRRKGKGESFRATEVPVEERPPIIAAYRRVAGKTVTAYFTTLPDPADHPVFRIESRTT
jgi:deazaflavin-dependent oxidoreductase (nitroreductase family)